MNEYRPKVIKWYNNGIETILELRDEYYYVTSGKHEIGRKFPADETVDLTRKQCDDFIYGFKLSLFEEQLYDIINPKEK